MGYFRRLIEKQGMFSKKSLMYFVRDGNRYIKKVERENIETGIDPNLRCHRHDRPHLAQGDRGVPLPHIPPFY